MLADSLRHRHEDHAGLLQLFLEGRRNRNGIKHGVHRHAPLALWAHDASEDLLFAQRYAEFFVGLENFRIDFIERSQRLFLWCRIVIGVLIIDLGIVDTCPGRLPHGLPTLIGLQPPVQHPLRLAFLGRNETDSVFGKPLGSLLGFDIGDEPVFILVNVDTADLFDGLLYGRHSSLRSRFQGPRVGFVGYGRSLIALRSSQVTPRYAALACLLSNDETTVFQAFSSLSISASVVLQPRLMRTAPRARSGSTPIAANTCEACT